MADPSTPFSEQVALLRARVFALVQACPVGRVTTYGWIARALGTPRGARMIGWIMNESPQGVPAQRVISSKGELTGSWAFGGPDVMRQLLEQEGILFSEDRHVDLKRYGWDPLRDLNEDELERILSNANTSIFASPRLLHLLRNDPASALRSTPPRE